MTTTVEQVDVWRASSAEHENLEFKEARHQFDNDKLFDYCVAIANEGGGVILLGIAEHRRGQSWERKHSTAHLG